MHWWLALFIEEKNEYTLKEESGNNEEIKLINWVDKWRYWCLIGEKWSLKKVTNWEENDWPETPVKGVEEKDNAWFSVETYSSSRSK